MLATSVAVVKKILDAVQGSAPSRFKTNGMNAPERPLIMQLAIIATKVTKARIKARSAGQSIIGSSGFACILAKMNIPIPAVIPTSAPFAKPSNASLITSAFSLPGLSSPRVIPRRATASAWQPVFPDWPAKTGRKTARITNLSSVG